jgi:hypothetical protein
VLFRSDIGHTTGYLHLALQQAKATTKAFLSSIRELKTAHIHTSTLLKQALDGSFILTHQKKDTSTQATNYIISLADPITYAILATLTDPTKVTLPTNTITRGQIRHQIATLDLTAHTRSVLGRAYAQLLVDPDITQLNNNLTPLQYNQSRGLIGRPSDKITWATSMLGHTDVLQAYEEGMLEHDQEESPPPPTNTDQQNKGKPPTQKVVPKTTPENRNKGKDKMPPMTRTTPDPLKQMRQNKQRKQNSMQHKTNRGKESARNKKISEQQRQQERSQRGTP